MAADDQANDTTAAAPATVTGAELRAKANALFAARFTARHAPNQQLLKPGDELIAEVPSGPGETVTIVLWAPTRGGDATLVLRKWSLGPDGVRVPIGPNVKLPRGTWPLVMQALADADDRAQAMANAAPGDAGVWGRRP